MRKNITNAQKFTAKLKINHYFSNKVTTHRGRKDEAT